MDGTEILTENEECLPIKLFEELHIWEPTDHGSYNICPLQKRTLSGCPKTLLCHDMKGGYLDDRFLNGTSSENNYYFFHWAMVDIFVYFSHHLVTIPPHCWINAAHRNGVKVLGTFITEWDAGAQVCDSLLRDEDSVSHICNQLVRIANLYKFDGWLINIENKLNQNQVHLLEEFVALLTKKMHDSQQDSLVIWYDSVTETGELKWQNALNEHNRNFFHACDGIFLNYNWTRTGLKSSIIEAGRRRMDVFVGVDVFGRSLGLGGYDTHVAVSEAREFNLSVAVFAPGWVFECNDVKYFKENEYEFWHSLVENFPPRFIAAFPYYTSFCPGFGQKLFRNGKVEHSKPWFNLNLQQPQPSYHYKNCLTKPGMIIFHTEDAFNGGGCLKLSSKAPASGNSAIFQILSTNIPLRSRCLISYTFKALSENTKVTLALSIAGTGKFYFLNLLGKQGEINDERHAENPATYGKTNSLEMINKLPTSENEIKHSEDDEPWIKREYRLDFSENEELIKTISLEISYEGEPEEKEVAVLLGELLIAPIQDAVAPIQDAVAPIQDAVAPIQDVAIFFYKDLILTTADESCLNMECCLEWNPAVSPDFCDLYVIINGSKNYIITTCQLYYKFKGRVPKGAEIKFMLNRVYLGNATQPKFLEVPLNI